MINVRLAASLIVAMTAVSSCNDAMHWSRPNTTQDQFAADDRTCFHKAHKDSDRPTWMEGNWYFAVYQTCMVNLGYDFEGLSVNVGTPKRLFEPE